MANEIQKLRLCLAQYQSAWDNYVIALLRLKETRRKVEAAEIAHEKMLRAAGKKGLR